MQTLARPRRGAPQLKRHPLDGGVAINQVNFLPMLAVYAVVVGIFEISVWTAARRFGLPAVLLLWLLASLLLLGFYAWRLSQVSPWPLPPRMAFVGAFAVLLAFGLAARSIWRSVQTHPPTPLPPLPVALKAAGFWVLGFVGGLLPLLVMDIINFAAV